MSHDHGLNGEHFNQDVEHLRRWSYRDWTCLWRLWFQVISMLLRVVYAE